MRQLLAYISIALRQLTRHASRSVLTMLGIIIGIASVIYILTAGEIAKNFLLGQISQFGTNVIEVAATDAFSPFGESGRTVLDESDVELIENSPLLPEVGEVSAGYTLIQDAEVDGSETTVTIFADRPAVFPVNNVVALKGRLFNSADYQNASRVVVVGERFASEEFGSTDVVGERLKIGGTFFTVIGVIDDFGPGAVSIGPEIVFMPLTTARRLFIDPSQHQEISFLLIEFVPGTNVESFRNRLDYSLRQHHNLLESDETVFAIVSREQALEIFNTVLLGIQAFISAVAAISLLVGGIGIMNIMLVTVKERTKEIGLRKAVGANERSVLLQFLIESVVLTTVGGIIGILLGLGLSLGSVWLVNLVQPDWAVRFLLVPSALVWVTAISVSVGLVFGLYPAVKAARLHPIEALRYE